MTFTLLQHSAAEPAVSLRWVCSLTNDGGLRAKSSLALGLEPMDCSPPGSSVHGILQARIQEWVAVSFPGGSSWPKDQTCISCIAGGSLLLSHQRSPVLWVTRKNLRPKLSKEKPLKSRPARWCAFTVWASYLFDAPSSQFSLNCLVCGNGSVPPEHPLSATALFSCTASRGCWRDTAGEVVLSFGSRGLAGGLLKTLDFPRAWVPLLAQPLPSGPLNHMAARAAQSLAAL